MENLAVKKLHVVAGGRKILKGLSLSVKPGEIHALMGPNGSGKSTLASAIMGHPGYRVTNGSIWLKGKRITAKKPDERARLGLFLSFQYPVEVPGLSIEHFLRSAYRAVHPDRAMPPLEFRKHFEHKLKLLGIRRKLTDRSLNEGFSGGEKKKMEILQLAVLEPTVAILDETDSGLDIDALRAVTQGINRVMNPQMSILVITHYCRILKYLKPDHVHVVRDGKLVRSGARSLATQIERRGYDWLWKKGI
ncbi:MAG: Fe-S cluster assembly ATPase SufC [Patescibacteria group bacterium]